MTAAATDCPDDETIAALVDGALPPDRRRALLAHAADCDECRALLSELAQGDAQEDGAPDAGEARAASALARRLGRYELLHTIGAGGMGIVYAAHDRELDRRVALKVLRDDGANAAARTALLREARAMARLAHPNVVRVIDVGELDGRVFVTMELVQGGTLREWLRAAPRSFEDITRVFQSAGRGLAAAHAAGIVHRDFKPENVLLDGESALVTDFGLARVSDEALGVEEGGARTRAPDVRATGTTTRASAVAGTFHYMAPEQLRGERIDARSDVFAFSVALWEALSGSLPFAGASPAERLAAIERGPPSVRRRDVPKAMRAALERGLSFDPAARPASMDAFLAAAFVTAERRARHRAGLVVLLGAGMLAAAFAAFTTHREPAVTQNSGAAWQATSDSPAANAPADPPTTAVSPPAPVRSTPTSAPAAPRASAPPTIAPRAAPSTAPPNETGAPSASVRRGPGGVFVSSPY